VGELFKPAIKRLGLPDDALIGLARLTNHALHIDVAPRFFDIVGKFIVGHFLNNEIAFDQIADVLEHADILLDLKVTKFPAFAAFTTEEKGIGVVVVLNVGNELRKFGVVAYLSAVENKSSG
jgi:hypothetical protein